MASKTNLTKTVMASLNNHLKLQPFNFVSIYAINHDEYSFSYQLGFNWRSKYFKLACIFNRRKGKSIPEIQHFMIYQVLSSKRGFSVINHHARDFSNMSIILANLATSLHEPLQKIRLSSTNSKWVIARALTITTPWKLPLHACATNDLALQLAVGSLK